MINSPETNYMASAPVGFVDRVARRVVTTKLAGLHHGKITVCDSGGESTFGETADMQATLFVNRPRFFRSAMLGGTLSVAESYIRGDWECNDLTTFFRIFVGNQCSTGRFDRGLASLASRFHRFYHWWHANTIKGSRQNIGAHYDLGNDFFRLWLDDSMAYSCGIFASPKASLFEASIEKFDRICRRLSLKPADNIVEIGTGWGGFALHAAKNYGCHVTTTTISDKQFQSARQQIQDAGLTDRINLLQQDYRNLHGQFDKLVSIEMIEAVGYRFLDDYFRQCSRLLRPHGTMALQAIVMPEQRYRNYLNSVDFIQRFVFPGGCLPSLGAMLASVGRATDLRFLHAEDFTPHYAETLRRWRQAFHHRIEDVRRQGFPEEFIRLWNYYLCYCEAAFAERQVGLLQIQFDKPDCQRDLVSQVENGAKESNHAESDSPRSRSHRKRSLCEQ